jgi:hypothetical protein
MLLAKRASISGFRSVICLRSSRLRSQQPNRHHNHKLSRAGGGRFPESPRNGTPRVYSVRRRFSAPAHGTQEARLLCGVLPAIRVRSGQTNPLWTKITPDIAGLAAGSHARRPALNEIREFRKTMPRPRRGSELVFGGQRAAKSSCRCPPPPPPPHEIRMSVHVCMVFGVVTSPEAPCGATWRSRHPSCTKRCVYPQLDIKGASICCTERGYISMAGLAINLVQVFRT